MPHALTHFPRPRHICRLQLIQWWFAGAPGHPTLLHLLDTIRAHASVKMHADNVRDTLARTGPGAFTQAILAHAMERSAKQVGG